jgi:hypothetical protein
MGDFGAKLSQAGYDVNSAGNQDLLFSSSFPTLKEEKTGTYTGVNTNTDVLIYEHNLGYVPFFLVQINKGSGSEMISDNTWFVDENKLYTRDATNYKYRWTIYRLPLYQDFFSDSDQQASISQNAISKDFGMKFAKEGKDLSSTDLRDFTIHSRGRTPLIHAVSTKDWHTGDTRHELKHILSYVPLAFGFTQSGVTSFPPFGKTYQVFPNPQANPGIGRTNDTVFIGSDPTTSTKTSIVILKDPFITNDYKKVDY